MMRAVVQRDVVAAVGRQIRRQPLVVVAVRRADVPVAVDARAVLPIAGTGTRRSS